MHPLKKLIAQPLIAVARRGWRSSLRLFIAGLDFSRE
jgi:hypothetical protein